MKKIVSEYIIEEIEKEIERIWSSGYKYMYEIEREENKILDEYFPRSTILKFRSLGTSVQELFYLDTL